MKKVLAFDIDQTLNIAKTPVTADVAELLRACLGHFFIVPISGQKFEQFLVQIVEPLTKVGVTGAELEHLHLFVAQGTQYYRWRGGRVVELANQAVPAEPASRVAPAESASQVAPAESASQAITAGAVNQAAPAGQAALKAENWEQVYNYPLEPAEITAISQALEQAARELGYWEADQLAPGDEIIEDRGSQVTFSALGQRAGTEAKYAWDPDHTKRNQIATRAKELAPAFDYEVAGTTSVNVFRPGTNKEFGMTHMMQELGVSKGDILYFGDMTQPGGNDYPVVQMGIETITVRSHEDTAYALRGILGVL